MAILNKKTDVDKSWGITNKPAVRYDQIPELVKKSKAKVILEVGVFTGVRASKMIQAALENHRTVTYYGFDLFEDYTPKTGEHEAAPKPPKKIEVENRLKGPGVNLHLFKGNSLHKLIWFAKRVNLSAFKRPDFVFIDGGHSFGTVANDWHYIQKIMHEKTIVVFDDYLEHSEWLQWGCNLVVDNLSPQDYEWEKLEPHDRYSLKQCGSNMRKESNTWLILVKRKRVQRKLRAAMAGVKRWAARFRKRFASMYARVTRRTD